MIHSEEQFYQKISQGNGLTNKTIYLENKILTFQKLNLEWLTFENCTFNCDQLKFQNIIDPDLVLEFRNCTFNCEVSFSNCVFNVLRINDTKAIKSLNIRKGLSENNLFEVNDFQFSNLSKELPEIICDFYISNANFKRIFSFENIKHIEGKFQFFENTLGNKEKNNGQFIFACSTFTNAIFSRNFFNESTCFNNSTFKNDFENLKLSNAGYNHNLFYDNKFEKINFSNSNFIEKCTFYKCDFLSTTWFENCKNLKNSELKFVACEFKSFSLFNKSKINFLDIDRCTFDKSSSFTDAEFNTLKLFEVKFGGGAYFDEMKIKKVLDKSYLKSKGEEILEWKRTLRAIKQESQKTENKIDFNNYRNYELAAHYEELNYKDNFKDVAILWATKWSSNYGSWLWALGFTLISGLFWYCFLYRIENSGTLNFDKTNEFFVGAFRFFLVTDFHNPLLEESPKAYLTSGWSWLIFIFGKIFIAFGIYEMIQSFRKFKA